MKRTPEPAQNEPHQTHPQDKSPGQSHTGCPGPPAKKACPPHGGAGPPPIPGGPATAPPQEGAPHPFPAVGEGGSPLRLFTLEQSQGVGPLMGGGGPRGLHQEKPQVPAAARKQATRDLTLEQASANTSHLSRSEVEETVSTTTRSTQRRTLEVPPETTPRLPPANL